MKGCVPRALTMLSVALLLSGCGWLLPAPREPTVPGRLIPNDASEAVWQLDPDQPAPGPDATSFSAIVTERACASARDITGLILPPVIEYGADEVIVSIYVEPLPAGAQDCPGNPPARFTVELREPLGDRQLVDGIGIADGRLACGEEDPPHRRC